jgi:hypothetical protein
MLFEDFRITILALATVALVGLATLIVFMNRKHHENKLFGVWLLFVAAWSCTLALFFAAGDPVSAALWMKAAYATAIICIAVFFYFSMIFTKFQKIRHEYLVLDAVAVVGFAMMIMSTNVIVDWWVESRSNTTSTFR